MWPPNASKVSQRDDPLPESDVVAGVDLSGWPTSRKVQLSQFNIDAVRRNYERRFAALMDIGSTPVLYKTRCRYELFQPELGCPELERIGDLGDGGKWVCGLGTLTRGLAWTTSEWQGEGLGSPCVVYSFGSNGNRVFEEAVLQSTPCRIWTFDPNPDFGIHFKKAGSRNVFQPLWLQRRPDDRKALQAEGGTSGKVSPTKTLHQIMAENGHRLIHLLKVDVEGAEYDFIRSTFASRPADRPLALQINLETHMPEGHYWDLVKLARWHAYLANSGCLLYYTEPNPAYPHAAVEWSFIHESVLAGPGGTPLPHRLSALWLSAYNASKSAYFCASVWSKKNQCNLTRIDAQFVRAYEPSDSSDTW